MTHAITVLKLYGATWCADCKRSRDFLDKKRIDYTYIDIDTVPGAADEVAELNGGLKSIPTIVFSDESTLVEPTNPELAEKLGIRRDSLE